MAAETHKASSAGKDMAVYLCLLILAAIQFIVAYQNMSTTGMFRVMLSVAVIEAAIALLFFMHLNENRGLMWFVVIFSVAVLLGLQFGWTDSYRLINGVPWAR
jgi:caa(3)-type oxidase subunit IV